MKRTNASFRTAVAICRNLAISIWLTLALSRASAQQRTAPPWNPPAAEVRAVEQLADVYKLLQTETVANYKTLFASDEVQGRRAESFFEEPKAYEILALALPHLSGTVRSRAIDALVSKKTFSHTVFRALVTELDSVNAIPVMEDPDLGVNTTLKTKICRAIAKWLEVPPPKVEMLSSDSVTAFSKQAKQKAATKTESHASD